MKEIMLQPGEFFFGQDDTIIRTHLGSCVAITMWHPEQKRGGMCHYMLPSRGHNDDVLDGRYADEAIQLFINEISKYPAPIHEYEVKLFGGGNMFIEQQTLNTMNVAIKNIKAAWQLTQHLGLSIKAHHLGHAGHRSLIFELANGNVWVRHHRLPHR
ncbi:chemotaxis protein CheD [Aeromonas piscicola]|jgi:chemotaxis protein CheD|uniref:chemoreceptor glutamine deamidase CheD n=1 Tax=Aeromonas TaxID=642 RepID=UPI0008081B64|nr:MULTISPECIES: chemoreceptor glutamine deamidase CheD [Aeromonas]MCW0504463.1 chemoreceptor glutamine deamidase CheD [Aeromonas piscicola]MCX7132461.1 chemoreceptor glutamine deamidase CheD [Aeromonas sp.]OCA62863.1 chemotaxis protein CheD [Aeromonas piscicola]